LFSNVFFPSFILSVLFFLYFIKFSVTGFQFVALHTFLTLSPANTKNKDDGGNGKLRGIVARCTQLPAKPAIIGGLLQQ
jgi:hypothetical protein